jgi:nicotinamidase-related amidase
MATAPRRYAGSWRMVMKVGLDQLLAMGRVALVLTEVQEGIIGASAPWPALAEAAARVDLVANAGRLAAKARHHGAPVVHCTAEILPDRFGGNANARLFSTARKVRPTDGGSNRLDDPLPAIWAEGDIKLPRYHGVSPMTGGPLDALLRNQEINTLIVVGVSLSFGVLNLVMDAVNRAYQVIVPRDAVAGFPEPYAQMVLDNTLSMLATVTTTAEIVDAWT